MKKFLLILILTSFTRLSQAQITLEHDYPSSATLTELALSGWKYYLMDVANNQCRIYQMNHTLWKTVSLSVPSGMYLYDVRLVSETLFNSDSKVEMAYIYYSYDTTLFYYTYYMKVVNEDGAVLLSVPGCAYADVKTAGTYGTKLLAYVYDYSIVNWTVNTLVYSLPGTPVSAGDQPGTDAAYALPFPNPAGSFVNIPRGPSAGHGSVDLLNPSGQRMRTVPIDERRGTVTIPLNGLPAGMYFYRLSDTSGATGQGRFIHE